MKYAAGTFFAFSLCAALSLPASAAETKHYDCENEQIRIGYTGDYAILDYQNQLFLLKTAISASGTRYVGENWQWWTKSGEEGNLAPKQDSEDFASDEGRMCKLLTEEAK